jgi:hypothetical protein
MEKVKGLLEKALLSGDEEIASEIIKFFEKQKITPNLSAKFWDLASRKGLKDLSFALDAVRRLQLPLTIPSNFGDYDDSIRQKWLLFLTERIHI